MTPKDKAIELVWKYYHNIEHTISNEYASKDWEIAKQCALIAVDEIIKLEQARLIVGSHNYYDYYVEVKQEIEIL